MTFVIIVCLLFTALCIGKWLLEHKERELICHVTGLRFIPCEWEPVNDRPGYAWVACECCDSMGNWRGEPDFDRDAPAWHMYRTENANTPDGVNVERV